MSVGTSKGITHYDTGSFGLMENVDARTKLAGSNKMEILLFSLGTIETFGINVFKVREVSQAPKITKTPNMPFGVEGVISLRGNIIPVINLRRFIDSAKQDAHQAETMVVTEFSRTTQAFLVQEVDRIIRVEWDRVRAPESMLSGSQAMITGITELDDGKLVSILDVEQIIASVVGDPAIPEIAPADTHLRDNFIFAADDSVVARREISAVLEKLQVRFQVANNGKEAWDKLQNLANRVTASGDSLRDHLTMILTDAEMPEMDGYVLTKQIKSDFRFEGIPVIMHSSLSSNASRAMGSKVGVDAYVAKFDPMVLAETLKPFLR